MTALLAAVSTSEPGQVVVGQFDGTQDGNLMLFIDHAIVPILVQRWMEHSVGSESDNAAATSKEVRPAA